ncbi:auxin response factor 2-like [Papaver somniferum]|uniref:auxin response factor 2-like n=1 Tax=Papaver somniferum TaxID=3469 RepID=UPI000E6F5708|nr:auxin response factor 2-like [Papaver somniferum]
MPSQQTSQHTPTKRHVSKSPAIKKKQKNQPSIELDEEHDTLEALSDDDEECGETDTDLDEEEPDRYEEGKSDRQNYDDAEGEEVKEWTCDIGEKVVEVERGRGLLSKMMGCVGAEGLNLEGICPDIIKDPTSLEQVLLCKSRDERDGIYGALWNACAGPSVKIPRIGEKVFYFPQGHLEQVEAYTNQRTSSQMPVYDLPSKILCRVIYVQLKAEMESDEVFAQVTLVPDSKQDEPGINKEKLLFPPKNTKVYSFCKILTPSDTSTHGGFSVLRRHANECLPPLDMSQQPPCQELVAKDLHGVEWRFRHIYRGQPKRHLLTSGWSTFVNSKKLVAGDTFIFIRAEDGELRVGFRRASSKMQSYPSTSVISSHTMQLGILATASHALSTGSMFSVYYRPRTSPSEFLIPYKQYMNSVRSSFAVGTRFKMRIDREEAPEERPSGTLVGIEEDDPVHWPCSQWKCLVAHWDEPSSSVPRPLRISPWMIEPLSAATNMQQVQSRTKRLRTSQASPDESSTLCNDAPSLGLSLGSTEHAPPLPGQSSGVFHGQENGQIPSNPNLIPPRNYNWGQNPFPFQRNDPFYMDPGNNLPINCAYQDVSRFGSNFHPPLFSTCNDSSNSGFSENRSVPQFSFPSSGFPGMMGHAHDEVPMHQQRDSSPCMLFGVDLVKIPMGTTPASEMSFPQFFHDNCHVPHFGMVDSDQISDSSKITNPSYSSGSGSGVEKPCQSCSNTPTKFYKGISTSSSKDLH